VDISHTERDNEEAREWIRGMSDGRAELTTSDQVLVEKTRGGDQRAFAELWRRHYRSGARVARQFTSSIDPDDLVSEAYTRIYQRVLAGGGPTGAFRPYLYTTIRNLASTWGAAARDVQVDDIADYEDPATLDDPVAIALDRTLTARAFRSLPERWQSVLWYTEVEGMDPHEVAPLLGMSANGVAALSYRAREGLRKAWLQAHITDAAASGECQWALSRLGDHARHSLGQRDAERMSFHLATCSSCAIISEEVDEVGSRLALVMLPILLGGLAGGAYLSSTGTAAAAAAASAAIPAAPHVVGAGVAAVGVTGLVGAATTPALVGGLAVLVAFSGAALVLAPTPTTDDTAAVSTEPEPGTSAPTAGDDATETLPIDHPARVPELGPGGTTLQPVVDLVGSTLDSLSNGLTGGTPPDGHTAPGGVVGIDLTLSGTATPGAHLSLQAAGQVYATTQVASDGTFTLAVTGIPSGVSSLALVQNVDRDYLRSLLGTDVLGGLLGNLDALIDSLVCPITLQSGASDVTIDLIS
jgi:RNA polymerase sigma factor (sigma-70 family)